MSISFDNFLDWAERKFGYENVKVSGSEVQINSIFTDDNKRKMWCNPYGGKKGNPHGVYHCWKTGQKGSLVSLVMMVEKCEYEEALEILGGQDITLWQLEEKVNSLFDLPKTISVEETVQSADLSLPPFTFPIQELDANNYFRIEAEVYLQDRKIPIGNLHVCTKGQYANRIVIPYYNSIGKLIYYNCRTLDKKNQVKYLGPPKDIGIGKSDILFFPKWPKQGEKVYLTEGEFDAISICESDLLGGGFAGKEMNEKQIVWLLEAKCFPVFCLDGDKAGTYALLKINELRPNFGAYVRLPKVIKDWNDFLVKYGPNVLRGYIEKNTKNMNEDSLVKLKSELL